MLDDANKAMRGLDSVTIDGVSTATTGGGGSTSRLTTDLKSRCTFRTTSANGAGLEQIRIGKTDYVRPNRTYLKLAGHEMTRKGEQKYWAKKPADAARPDDGLSACTGPFASFGIAKKGGRIHVGGLPAMSLIVTDKATKGDTYTFYVATRGKPYILKTVYRSADFRTVTSFSAFNKPLDLHAPAKADIADTSLFE
ncbi:hypothetical protein [Streptomyces fuscigenes]|uniref:hypothetical protein n=1 Tax=Streptomyces fuscigenes TaxID=1528880 RepID=UPI001F413C24|nr:hypothetical protein [Streptomyces fuscigenes]MCF3960919.1 hypothetical protein [Streptomyces fuscigenes]